ncbi:MAG: hypothetical protein KKE73_14625 [Proteobacteria bacterium]|nr:hypothetical protein [Pseudomonadota bacterium]
MKRLVASLAIILCLGALWGCSSTNVKHLIRQPWTLDNDQTLTMKFWRFDYRIAPTSDQFCVRGTAFPLSDTIPAWANKVADIWFAAYLSDASGKVIAQDLRVFEPGPLDQPSGIGFEFRLKPQDLPTKSDLFITFGYRMKLSGDTDKGEVFFASEGAMTRF